MSRNDIIRMAQEAGLMDWNGQCVLTDGQLERFARLVASAEREACAKMVDAAQPFGFIAKTAAAIRARSKE